MFLRDLFRLYLEILADAVGAAKAHRRFKVDVQLAPDIAKRLNYD